MRITLRLLWLLLLLNSCVPKREYVTVSLKPKGLEEILDTSKINYTSEFHLLDNLVIKLVSLDEGGNYILELASEIKKVNDVLYELKIKDAKFSNNEKITLSDVRSTLLRNVKLGGAHVSLAQFVKSVEVSEDKLVIALKRPEKTFLYYLSLPDLGILHKTQYEKDELIARDFNSVTSGPFLYKCDSYCFLAKNEKFYGPKTYPGKIKLVDPFKMPIINELIEEKIDIGQVGVGDYIKKRKELSTKDSLHFLGTKSDALTYLFFNKYQKRPINLNERIWLYQKITSNFEVPSHYNDLARKTLQYFPPESPAYIENIQSSPLPSIDLDKIPERFKDGIKIHTYTTAPKVTIWEMVKKLEEIRGLKINVLNDVEPSQYDQRLKKGDIDIFVGIMSSDYRIPVEAISFEFFSPDSKLIDESGNIKKLFNSYQLTNETVEEKQLLQSISREIYNSAYVVPLFHSAIPLFYNANTVDFGGLNHLFAFNFWKIKSR